MSASKITSPPAESSGHILHLAPDQTLIRKNGIEFRSSKDIAPWTEMTVALRDPVDGKEITANGIVIESHGDRHQGYHVSMVFLNLSPSNQARLGILAYSNLA